MTKENNVALNKIDSRYGGFGLANKGFSQPLNVLRDDAWRLGLDSTSIHIVWMIIESAETFNPSHSFMAKRAGCSVDTIQRRLATMEKKGFVKITTKKLENDKNDYNRYDFTGLFAELNKELTGEATPESKQAGKIRGMNRNIAKKAAKVKEILVKPTPTPVEEVVEAEIKETPVKAEAPLRFQTWEGISLTASEEGFTKEDFDSLTETERKELCYYNAINEVGQRDFMSRKVEAKKKLAEEAYIAKEIVRLKNSEYPDIGKARYGIKEEGEDLEEEIEYLAEKAPIKASLNYQLTSEDETFVMNLMY